MKKFYIAIAAGSNGGISNNNSGRGSETHPPTKENALTWARTHLGNNPNTPHVLLLEGVAVVERTSPPLKVTPLDAVEPTLDLDESEANSSITRPWPRTP